MMDCALALDRALATLAFWRAACLVTLVIAVVLGLALRFQARPR